MLNSKFPCISVAFAVLSSLPASAEIRPARLRCEYRVNPLGIDAPAPRLTWALESAPGDSASREKPSRAQVQSAYRIIVASSRAALDVGRADLWDSGKVASDQTAHVVYDGKILRSGMECWWKVRVWDGDGNAADSEPAAWTMGLLEPSDWTAKWIGCDEAAAKAQKPLHMLTGADLAGCKWVWHPEGDPVKNAPEGTRFFRKAIEIPGGRVVTAARIVMAADDRFVLFLNGTEAGRSGDGNDTWSAPSVFDMKGRIAPGRNCIAVAATTVGGGPAGLIGKLVVEFETGEPMVETLDDSWKVSSAEAEGWKGAEFNDEKWRPARVIAVIGDSPWGTPGGSGLYLPPPPRLRREFTLDKPIRRAVLYASAFGLYKAGINGKRVGEDFFTPGWTDYKKRVYYNTYDVTGMVRQGGNAIVATLADGWYCGYVAWGRIRNRFGRNPRLRMQLNIEFEDGSTRVIATDESWRAATGPQLEADFLMGETFDATLETPGWDMPGFDDSKWLPVAWTQNVTAKVEAYPGVTVRRTGEVPAKKITSPAKGVHIFDLGQNFAGWVRLKVNGPRGTKVVMRFAEVLNPDGTLYVTNLRGARATDYYILNGGGEEVWEPDFTFHGFRYVEVTGYPGEPGLDTITGVRCNSDAEITGTFECSNPMVNQLFSNIVWTQRANYIEVPTDCPQRDERLGWTGDAQVFIRTATFTMDAGAFFTKWLVDLEDAQRADGSYTDVAPDVGLGSGSPAWADAGTICPHAIHLAYGDKKVIQRHYQGMKRYIEFLRRRGKDPLSRFLKQPTLGNLLKKNMHIQPAAGYGDWLSIKADTPKEVLATAYYANSARLMAEMARALGNEEDAKEYGDLFDEVREAFNQAFVSGDGRIRGETQTCYLMALDMDLLPEDKRPAAFAHLVEDIEKRDCHLSTGFVGIKHLLPVLTRYGRGDLAHRLLANDTFPSWGYSIRHGATSIWERWDGWTEHAGFQDPGMNSFAHYAFGCVGQWLFAELAGIDADPAAPGFKRVIVRPHPGGGMKFAHATYRSIRGDIKVAWESSDTLFKLNVAIPPNTTAVVHVPAGSDGKVYEGGVPAAQAKGVRFVRRENGIAIFEIGSGEYEFVVK
ncbi:MAG TPA: family 78 glycoside hydrolase catalytic domain [Candidatus Brocadiia bacterium]|nr:family 78 glycoside hydrolase catalytic domain [Candidatus Brocadiia bacterium]